jgi:hypothetical protein
MIFKKISLFYLYYRIVYAYLYGKYLKMKKFNKFGLRVPLFVWKINRATDGTVTYTCSNTKGKDEKNYTDKEVYFLTELF